MSASARAKGRAFERLVGTWLRAHFWVVDDEPRGKVRAIGPGRFISSPVDLFGCIDIVAMHQTRGIWFIQATSGGDVAAKKREVAALPWPPDASHLRVSVIEDAARRHDLNPRRIARLARVHDLLPGGSWKASEVVDLGT